MANQFESIAEHRTTMRTRARWHHDYLRDMVRGYLECAVWCGHVYESEEDEREGRNSCSMDSAGYSIDDCPYSTVKAAVRDCRDFLELTAGISHPWWTAEQFGHDFYLTRCRHGAGFWDRGQGETGERLTDLCRGYGSADLFADREAGRLYWY